MVGGGNHLEDEEECGIHPLSRLVLLMHAGIVKL